MARHKIIVLTMFLFALIFSILMGYSIAYFTSIDKVTDNYLHIGKIKEEPVSVYLFAATGPTFTYRVDIPFPSSQTYDYSLTLKGHPYHNWSLDKANEILDIMTKDNGVLSKDNATFAKNLDKDYFKRNNILFDSNNKTGFLTKQGFHLFAVITNKAHLKEDPQRISLSNDTVVFNSFNKLKGTVTGREWGVKYKGNVDFNHNRYYVTHAYTYNRATKQYNKVNRGSWNYYNKSDLVITDLGLSGDIEMSPKKWSGFGVQIAHKIKVKMFSPYKGKNDSLAKVISASYNVTYIPSGNKLNATNRIFKIGDFD